MIVIQAKRRFPIVTLLLAGMLAGVSLYADGTDAPPADVKRPVGEGHFLQPPINKPPLDGPLTRVVVIPIRGNIMPDTYGPIPAKVAQARAKDAQLVIFDIETNGGRGDVMEDIITLIRDELSGIRTVAFINSKAFSAGAMIAAACDEIIVRDGSAIGAATPYLPSPTGVVDLPAKIQEKFESAARSLVAALRRKDMTRQNLLQGMITREWELWLIENETTRERRVVRGRDWRHRVRNVPPPTDTKTAAVTVQSDTPWIWLETVVDSQELVSLPADKAYRCGLADGQVADWDALRKRYGIEGEMTYLGNSASEKFVAFLNSSLMQTLLFSAMIFAGYIEFNTPGFGVAGGVALACLGVIVLSRFLFGVANAIEIVVLLVGVVLLAMEIFITPGFGVLGISGIVVIVAALAAMLIPNAPKELPLPRTNMDWSMLTNGLGLAAAGAIAAMVGAGLVAHYLPRTPVLEKLILKVGAAEPDPALSKQSPLLDVQPGDTGVVEATCRPAGKVRFGDDLLDAVSEGAIISPGTTVRVLRRSGNRIVVEEA